MYLRTIGRSSATELPQPASFISAPSRAVRKNHPGTVASKALASPLELVWL